MSQLSIESSLSLTISYLRWKRAGSVILSNFTTSRDYLKGWQNLMNTKVYNLAHARKYSNDLKTLVSACSGHFLGSTLAGRRLEGAQMPSDPSIPHIVIAIESAYVSSP